MRIVCVALVVACAMVGRPAWGQATRPSSDLAKENAELRKRIERLEAYAAELEAKLKNAKPTSPPQAFKVPSVPRIPAPFGYELPAPPFRQPTPVPTPAPKAEDAAPAPPPPRDWLRHRFNGMEYYVVPLQ